MELQYPTPRGLWTAVRFLPGANVLHRGANVGSAARRRSWEGRHSGPSSTKARRGMVAARSPWHIWWLRRRRSQAGATMQWCCQPASSNETSDEEQSTEPSTESLPKSQPRKRGSQWKQMSQLRKHWSNELRAVLERFLGQWRNRSVRGKGQLRSQRRVESLHRHVRRVSAAQRRNAETVGST